MKSVEQQVEQILDEQGGRTVQVLIHMGGPTAHPEAEEADDDPQLAFSAREVLPEAVRTARADAIRAGADGGGVPRARPPARKLAAATATATSLDTLRASNQAGLRPLLESEPARRNVANLPHAITTFWISRSAFLELDRDDLPRLVAEIPGIQAVYPNQRLYPPQVSQARDLPAAVLEDSAASWGLIKTGALAAWGAYGARGAGVTVGVLDTGADATHPDLDGKVRHWAQFAENGQPVAGSTPHDSGIHGTHVCGTIAGGNASGQWIGMAPEASLAVAQVLGGGSANSLARIEAGIQWALEQGVDVLSLSLSAPVWGWLAPNVFRDTFQACRLAGVPVVAAIGNRGSQTGASTGSDRYVLAAGATDHRDAPAGFSGGQTHFIPHADRPPVIYTKPDVSGPGVAVTSAVPGRSWASLNGTSMATPHVSGAIALLLSAVPEIRTGLAGSARADFLSNLVKGSADELGEAGLDSRYGWGRLNVLRAIALAKQNV